MLIGAIGQNDKNKHQIFSAACFVVKTIMKFRRLFRFVKI